MKSSSAINETPLIRLAHPLAFTAFLQKVGAPTSRLIRQHGLPEYCDDPTAFVPLRRAWSLFDAAAALEDPMLAWHVGRFYGDSRVSGGFLKKIEYAPTLYRALQECVRLISMEATHLRLGLVERRDDVVFYTHYPTIKDWRGYTSSQAYQLGVYVDLVRHYVGQRWEPPEIGIEHPSVPAVAEEQFPGSRILAGQRFGYLTVPRACLHTPPPPPKVETEGDPPARATRFEFPENVSVLVRAYMSDGYPSAQKIARLLGTSERTLHRWLSRYGLGYQQVVDDVRFNAAKKLLEEKDAQVIDVAHAVGFDDAGHFSRMFSRVGGLSPTQYRRQALD